VSIANQNTTRTAAGGTYQPLRLISGPQGGFAAALDTDARAAPSGVQVLGLEAIASDGRKIRDPSHPDADAGGYVTYPGVDHAGEMALLVKTARVYESNLTALSLAQQMNMRALEIGKR
jgi:flagellar basal-body rod protein FlgC